MELTGKIAVITGAGGGIGQAIAEKLARSGMKLVLLGGRNTEKLETVRNRIEPVAPCVILPGELTDLTFLASAVEDAAKAFGGIDVLINNAGTAQSTPFEKIGMEEYDRIMAINVRTPFFLMQKALPYLKKSETPTILNIASVVAHSGYPLQSVYSASKHALLGLTKSVAREYFGEGIRVHAVCPGGVYTDMVKVSRPDLSPEGMIMPEDVAGIVHFLLSNRNNAVIDEILVHRAGKEPFLV